MNQEPRVSVIVPCKEVDAYARECIEHCKQLRYDDYEIVLLPDGPISAHWDDVKVVPTGAITPGAKRNIGLATSSGEICGFLDSDAYPRRDWLHNAVKYFRDPSVGAIGGPSLTPGRDSFKQKASGYVTSSFMVAGLSTRYKQGTMREVDDMPSCNFLARRSVIERVGGWNERYWPGEDTLMCLAITRLGHRIILVSDIAVYHSRRPLFVKHLTQVARFGLHRGFFAKRFGGNSLRLTYLVPSIFLVMLLLLAVMSFASGFSMYLLGTVLATYTLGSLLATIVETRDIRMIPIVCAGIWLTHLVYGTYFIGGLLKQDL